MKLEIHRAREDLNKNIRVLRERKKKNKPLRQSDLQNLPELITEAKISGKARELLEKKLKRVLLRNDSDDEDHELIDCLILVLRRRNLATLMVQTSATLNTDDETRKIPPPDGSVLLDSEPEKIPPHFLTTIEAEARELRERSFRPSTIPVEEFEEKGPDLGPLPEIRQRCHDERIGPDFNHRKDQEPLALREVLEKFLPFEAVLCNPLLKESCEDAVEIILRRIEKFSSSIKHCQEIQFERFHASHRKETAGTYGVRFLRQNEAVLRAIRSIDQKLMQLSKKCEALLRAYRMSKMTVKEIAEQYSHEPICMALAIADLIIHRIEFSEYARLHEHQVIRKDFDDLYRRAQELVIRFPSPYAHDKGDLTAEDLSR